MTSAVGVATPTTHYPTGPKRVGLLPLEFADCLLDSPYFRENLRAHEKQLDQTSADIKGIIKDIQVSFSVISNCDDNEDNGVQSNRFMLIDFPFATSPFSDGACKEKT